MTDLDHIRFHQDRIDEELARIERHGAMLTAIAGSLRRERAALRALLNRSPESQGAGHEAPTPAAGPPRQSIPHPNRDDHDGGRRGLPHGPSPVPHSDGREPAAVTGGRR